jgi:ubiquinone biosynthesis protein
MSDAPSAQSILHSLPRREQLIRQYNGEFKLPYIPDLNLKADLWKTLRRLLTWFRVLVGFFLANLGDRLTRRDTAQRRAVRLRKSLENAGGTFVKLGQQAAMRIDLLPWEYCIELSKMLDTMIPFPVEQALAAVERTIKRPWQEVFEIFDPVPVGSASIACVYQATLKDGTKVVVKVRRPGIMDIIMADLQVLDWMAGLAEFLTILRPGYSANLRFELRQTLGEELDFQREGRFQDTFRRNARKSGKDFFSAPKVYFEYSGREVLVQEFITGLRLWEVIAAVEGTSPKGRLWLSQLNIDPKVVARNIMWVNFWSADENLFFHADPHPANIIVRPNNDVVFIDFGSCGSFNNQQRMALEQMVLSMKDQDVETMSRATLNLMEPLPPVDLPSMLKQAQEEYMRVLTTFAAPAEYTQYWERTTARLWLGLIRISRKFNVSINLHMLRMIRATLLYDSIVLRLDNQLDRYDEYTLFMKDRAQLIKKRWRKKMKENSGDQLFLNIEDLGTSFNDLMVNAQTVLNKPLVNFGSTVNKWIFMVSVLSRMFGRIFVVTILGLSAAALYNYFAGLPITFQSLLSSVFHNSLYWLFILVAFILNFRQIAYRLRDRDVN